MAAQGDVTNLEALLGKLAEAGHDHDAVSVRDLRDAIGRRSFAPLLLATSLVGFTPLGGIPGVPTTLAVIIVFIATQIVLGCDSIWLPKFILDRRIPRSRLERGVNSLQSVARLIDKVIRPRLVFLTLRPYSYLIALICILLSFTVPPLELVPFIDIPLWGAIVAFSLALVAHDGLLVIVAFVLTGAGLALIMKALL